MQTKYSQTLFFRKSLTTLVRPSLCTRLPSIPRGVVLIPALVYVPVNVPVQNKFGLSVLFMAPYYTSSSKTTLRILAIFQLGKLTDIYYVRYR